MAPVLVGVTVKVSLEQIAGGTTLAILIAWFTLTVNVNVVVQILGVTPELAVIV